MTYKYGAYFLTLRSFGAAFGGPHSLNVMHESVAHAEGGRRVRRRQQTPWPRFRMGFPARLATSRSGGQGGRVFDHANAMSESLVTTNQRPLNSGRWRVGARSCMEKTHVRVHTVGENYSSATASGGHTRCQIAAPVATHLAMAGRGVTPGPFMVFMHNIAFNRDGLKPAL